MVKRRKSIPKGFYLVKGATTAPVGYRLYSSRKPTESRFKKRKTPVKHVYVKEKRR